jgi:hypothetical protein
MVQKIFIIQNIKILVIFFKEFIVAFKKITWGFLVRYCNKNQIISMQYKTFQTLFKKGNTDRYIKQNNTNINSDNGAINIDEVNKYMNIYNHL